MSHSDDAIQLAAKSRDRYLEELKTFLAIPSISTLSARKGDITRAAEWLAGQLRHLGMKVEILPTRGHPVVYGEWLEVPGKPTVLVYGHYDVQPVDPIDEWTSPPFEPTVRGENLYARGASDMKGQIFGVLKALEALRDTGGLPLNVKVMVEGEEEIGSPHLKEFLQQEKRRLACDLVLNADTGVLRPDLPAIAVGLRGLAYFEILVQGPAHDLHSGGFGGALHNPAQALCELIAGMHDADGRVTLPGFYDKVRVLSAEERAELAREPHSDEEWLLMAGVSELHGEKGFTTLERLGARPTLEVNGLLAGFVEEGIKTVLPAKAMAKISTRLVPDQTPEEAHSQLVRYMEEHAPQTIKWQVKFLSAAMPVLVERDAPGMQAAADALVRVFGKKPVFKLEGGTVPVVNMLQSILGKNSVQLGFGLPDDNYHGPNEKQHLPTFFRGIETYIRFFEAISESEH